MNILKPYKITLAKTLSQHWYSVWKQKGKKEKFLGHYPSSTTILNAYPQSPHLSKWIADNGWQESQRIKGEAGERGTRVHSGCDKLEDGETLMEDSYSTEEWMMLNSFVGWWQSYKPEMIAKEIPLFSKKYGYAGRVDRIYKINEETVVLDFKTSSSIHPHFPLQFASYAQAIEEMTDIKVNNTAALQLGNSNKDGYRFVVYPDWRDHLKVFLNVKEVWNYDQYTSKKNLKSAPVLELPEILKL